MRKRKSDPLPPFQAAGKVYRFFLFFRSYKKHEVRSRSRHTPAHTLFRDAQRIGKEVRLSGVREGQFAGCVNHGSFITAVISSGGHRA